MKKLKRSVTVTIRVPESDIEELQKARDQGFKYADILLCGARFLNRGEEVDQ